MSIKPRIFFLQKMMLLILVFVFLLPASTSFAQALYTNSKYDAMSYMLIEMESGKVLAQHDADRKIYPASTTKLMTALLLMEKKGLGGTTTVGTEINGLPSGSSLMHISVGEKISIKDLFYGLMLCSGNDAACTIAAYVSGSVDSFVALMNQRAAELGMTGTHFVSPYGAFLNQDATAPIPDNQLGINHYSTASDMEKLTLAVAKYPDILQAGSTEIYTLAATNKHDTRAIENSNPLVHKQKSFPELDQYYYKDATGLKTGIVSNIVVGNTTIRTYGNVVATASRNGLSLAALIFDDESEKSLDNVNLYSYLRWPLAADLFDFGFNNYTWVDLKPYIDTVSLTRPAAPEKSGGSQQGEFEISSQSAASPQKVLLDNAAAQKLKSGADTVQKDIQVNDTLQSAVQIGDKVGTVKYTLDGSAVYQADLVVTGQKQAEASSAVTSAAAGGNASETGGPGWLLWVIIPACAVGALFLIRFINSYLNRRKHRRRYQGRRVG